MMIQLTDLTTEALINIFGYCNVQDILNLRITCRRFQQIIEVSLPNRLFGNLLVTGQGGDIMKTRSRIMLTCLEKFRILRNWKYGKYFEKAYFYERERFLPRLQVTRDQVWFSRGTCVKAYRRQSKKIDLRPISTLTNDSSADVSKFVKNQHYVVAGLNDGHIWVWFDDEKKLVTSLDAHETEVNDIDVNRNLVLSGAKDGEFSLWVINNDTKGVSRSSTGMVENRIWSASFNQLGNYVALGTSCCTTRVPVYVFDPNRLDIPLHRYGTNLEKGSSVLHMKWLNNNILLTCGHDAHIRKWDMRVAYMCVQAWKDPFHATIYCMDTDNMHTLITGTQNYGRVVLYDMRHPKYVQLYFMQSCRRRGHSSPIYSLAFEPRLLFAATDQYLNVLDFTDSNSTPKDYSQLYQREICM